MVERSYLFVPGDRPERFDKALASGAHVVILDLEDAVRPEHKDAARDAVAVWLATAAVPVLVRINPDGTDWHERDLRLAEASAVRGFMLPKAENAGHVERLAQAVRRPLELIPLIETAAGHFEAEAFARSPWVTRLALGTYDFMADVAVGGDGEELDAVRAHLVLLSRWKRLPAPIDGVSLAIDDAEQLERDVQRSRRLGMGAKLCIHPRQVPGVHQGFAPTADEVAWARRVEAALAGSAHGAVAVDGKLVDKPLADRARAILEQIDTRNG